MPDSEFSPAFGSEFASPNVQTLTRVHVLLFTPSGQPAVGQLAISLANREHITVSPNRIVLPQPAYTVPLEAGAATLELAPTSPDQAWIIDEQVAGGITRHVTVPAATDVDYADLVDVDPAT